MENVRRYDAMDQRKLKDSTVVIEIARSEQRGVRRFDSVEDASVFFARELD